MARRKYVVGNWKMNGTRAALAEAEAIFAAARAHPGVDVAICPPFTLIAPMAAALPDAVIGAQDCHAAAAGAFTGSVAAAMLADVGAGVVIVGHSERREGCGERDEDVRAKAEAAATTKARSSTKITKRGRGWSRHGLVVSYPQIRVVAVLRALRDLRVFVPAVDSSLSVDRYPTTLQTTLR